MENSTCKRIFSLIVKHCNLAVIIFDWKRMFCYEAVGLTIPFWIKKSNAIAEAGVVKTEKDGKLGNDSCSQEPLLLNFQPQK